MSRSRDRHGFTLVEVLVALVLGAVVVQQSLHGLATASTVSADLVARSEGLDAIRTARRVLHHELTSGLANRDWSVAAPDAVFLRAFRGLGRVCEPGSAVGELLVVWEGIRSPDPTKDSLLLLDAQGAWVSAALIGSAPAPTGCPALVRPVTVLRWRIAPTSGAAVLLGRVFERGSYHFSSGSLRYRRGRGGRQPLTPDVLSTPPTRFVTSGPWVSVELLDRASGRSTPVRLAPGDGRAPR